MSRTVTNNGAGTGAVAITTVGSNVTAITNDASAAASGFNIGTLNINTSGTTTITNNSNIGPIAITNAVQGTGNLVLVNNNTGGPTVNRLTIGNATNSGTITVLGTGTSNTTLTTVSANVTAITQNSNSSNLTVTTLNVNSGGTTLTSGGSALFTVSTAQGTGDLILSNNSTVANGITLSTANNTGNITVLGNNTAGSVQISNANNTGSLTVNTSSNLTLSGTGGANGFSGGLYIIKGLVTSGQTGNGTSSPTIFGNGTIYLGNTAGGNSDNATLYSFHTVTNAPNAIVVQTGSSGILAIQGNGTATSQLFSGNVTLNNNLTLAQSIAGQTLTLSGRITGSSGIIIGNTGITNAGTVFITGSSNGTFTGNTTINGGTLNFTAGGLGNSTGTITFGGASTLQWGANNTQDISNKAISSTGFTGTLDLGANNVTFATANGLTGSGNFTKLAASAGVLALAAANDFSGTYTAATTGGATKLADSNALQNATVSLLTGITTGGITFDSVVSSHAFTIGGLTGAGNLTLTDTGSNAVALNVGNNNTSPAAYTGVLSGTGSLVKIGTGNLILSGNNTFSGGLVIKQGTVVANVSNNGATSGAAGPSGNATTLGSVTGGSASLLANSFTVSNAINLGANAVGTLTIGNNGSATAAIFSGAIGLNGDNLTIASTGTGSTTVSGGITGTGNLTIANGGTTAATNISNTINNNGTITNSGTSSGTTTINATIGSLVTGITQNSTTSGLTLSGNNTGYTGITTIKAGTLTLTNNSSGGTGTITLGDSSGNSSATLKLASLGTYANNIIVAAGSSGILSITNVTPNDVTISGTVALNNNLSWNGTTGTKTLTFTNLVTGDSTARTFTLVGGLATLSGGVSVGTGGLTFANNGASTFTVGAGNITSTTTGNLTFNANGTGAFTVSAASINHSGSITNSGAGNGTTTISGAIGGNVTAVIQNSPTSKLSLSNANTYAGATTISAGTLILASAGTIANSSGVNLGTSGSQGTLDLTAKASGFALGSNQTLSGYGNVTMAAGKTLTVNGGLAPGNSAGVIGVSGNLTLGSTATTTMDLIDFNLAPGTGFDQITLSGTTPVLTYSGTLTLNLTGSTQLGVYHLFTGFSSQSGTFTGGINYSGGAGSFSYATGDLTLTAVPEPATWMLLAFSLTTVIVLRRRRA